MSTARALPTLLLAALMTGCAVPIELSRDFAKRAADLEAEIHKLAGREFNVGSPKQLGEVMFDEMAADPDSYVAIGREYGVEFL